MSPFTQADVDAFHARQAAAKRRSQARTPGPEPRKSPPSKLSEAEIQSPFPPTASKLEAKFARLWSDVGGPDLVREHRFHATRKWRADFAHLPSRTLIEIEGGAWGGRHTRGDGFLRDAEKYLEAYLQGWSVVRLTSEQLTFDTVKGVAFRVAAVTASQKSRSSLPKGCFPNE